MLWERLKKGIARATGSVISETEKVNSAPLETSSEEKSSSIDTSAMEVTGLVAPETWGNLQLHTISAETTGSTGPRLMEWMLSPVQIIDCEGLTDQLVRDLDWLEPKKRGKFLNLALDAGLTSGDLLSQILQFLSYPDASKGTPLKQRQAGEHAELPAMQVLEFYIDNYVI